MSGPSVPRLAARLLGLVALAASFAWGFLAHRNRIFPFSLLRGVITVVDGRQRVELDRTQPSPSELSAIPYIGSAVDSGGADGAQRHRPASESPGLNLFAPWKGSEAVLVDMGGRTVHRWSAPAGSWTDVDLLPDGSIAVLEDESGVRKLDRDSRESWFVKARAHHCVSVGPDGLVRALVRRAEQRPAIHSTSKVIVDEVLTLGPDGKELGRLSLLDSLLRSPYAFLVPSVELADHGRRNREGDGVELDLLHANQVEAFDGTLAARSTLFRRGNLLVSFRTINAIAILDGASGDVLWIWGPSRLTRPHHPTLTREGRILLFNNGLTESEVLELDPLGRRLLWRYGPGPSFFSQSRGAVQQLANGNVLATLSDAGRAQEVTRDGLAVWEYASPYRDHEGKRRTMREVKRYRKEELPFLSDQSFRREPQGRSRSQAAPLPDR